MSFISHSVGAHSRDVQVELAERTRDEVSVGGCCHPLHLATGYFDVPTERVLS